MATGGHADLDASTGKLLSNELTAHGSSHSSIGADAIPDAVAGGASGLMSGSSLTKLNGVESGAQVVTEAHVRTALAAATADVSINSHKLTNASTPTASTDVATKGYADGLIVTPASGVSTATTSAPTTTSATYVTIPEMTVTLTSHGGSLMCRFLGAFNVQSNDDFTLAIFLDGVEVTASDQRVSFFGGSILGLTPAQINSGPGSCVALVSASAASHTITARWKVAAGTARAILTQRQLIVHEIL